ncbi:receptor protein kinase-like protein ZAR1 [Abeliophyllum distichum]|uniref:Receptor protein kinase-like protein ZAR1 n=1 Tax=Abeliophyllum distichum TaxID=126358 RepID=A0ABD1RHB3_9LAMI
MKAFAIGEGQFGRSIRTAGVASTNPQKLENPGVSSDGFVENKKIKLRPMTFSVNSGVIEVAGLGFLSVWVMRKWRVVVVVDGKTGNEENVDQEVRPGRAKGKGVGGPVVVAMRRLSEGEHEAVSKGAIEDNNGANGLSHFLFNMAYC